MVSSGCQFRWLNGQALTFSYRYHRKGYAYEALSFLIDFLHDRYPDPEFICFTDPRNIASKNLLFKLGYEYFGYDKSRLFVK